MSIVSQTKIHHNQQLIFKSSSLIYIGGDTINHTDLGVEIYQNRTRGLLETSANSGDQNIFEAFWVFVKQMVLFADNTYTTNSIHFNKYSDIVNWEDEATT